MRAEQAVFTSSRTARLQGYQLVARSPGITDALSRVITRWSPSHGGLHGTGSSAASISFYPAEDRWVVLSRTVFGGPEYSGRGSLQVFTKVLAIRTEQLRSFQYDPLRLAEAAITMGQLRFQPIDRTLLESVDVPDRSLSSRPLLHGCDSSPFPLVEECLDYLGRGVRIAIVRQDAIGILGQVIQRIEPKARLQLSFSTGLTPSQHRPFKIQTFSNLDQPTRHRLQRQGVTCLGVR